LKEVKAFVVVEKKSFSAIEKPDCLLKKGKPA
jgi:hypothetical protein